tara:strand:- start:1789 stop:2442 length:654 start_codon:yes stop_codon:yes gene_type:complete
MMLDVQTIQTLKAFAMINPSLLFKPGSVIKTISPAKTILAKATVPAVFDREFAIYDLMRFLGAYSMFEEADLDFGERSVNIGTAKESINYLYAEPACIVVAPDRELPADDPVVDFDLSTDVLQRTMKALSMIGAPEVSVTGRDGTVYLEAIDSKNSSSSTYKVELGSTNKTFQLIMAAEKLKLLPCDYKVSITDRFAYFKGPDIEYWISLELNSTVD